MRFTVFLPLNMIPVPQITPFLQDRPVEFVIRMMAPGAYMVKGHLLFDRTRFLGWNLLLGDVQPTGCRWIVGWRITP